MVERGIVSIQAGRRQLGWTVAHDGQRRGKDALAAVQGSMPERIAK